MLGMAIFWIIIIVAIVFAIRSLAPSLGRGSGEETPEVILKRRYASGSIDREEYERRLSDLRK